MTRITCPNCNKRPMHINHSFRSVPVYVCDSYGEGSGSCGYVISVTEYEIEHGSTTRLERIKGRMDTLAYSNSAVASADIEYLLSRLEIAIDAVICVEQVIEELVHEDGQTLNWDDVKTALEDYAHKSLQQIRS